MFLIGFNVVLFATDTYEVAIYQKPWKKGERNSGIKGNILEFLRLPFLGFIGNTPSKMSRRSWNARTKPRHGSPLSLKPCPNVSKTSSGSKPLRLVLFLYKLTHTSFVFGFKIASLDSPHDLIARNEKITNRLK